MSLVSGPDSCHIEPHVGLLGVFCISSELQIRLLVSDQISSPLLVNFQTILILLKIDNLSIIDQD